MNAYDATVREAKLRGDLIVYGFVQPNGVVRFSCSRSDPFAGAEVPTEVAQPGPRVNTRNLIEKIHQLAPQVAAAYGEEAVGELPSLRTSKRRKAKKEAA